ncbi:MAG: aminotransferase class V-fold PLP-dependent enzyme [Halobacteriota archaeon]
MRGYIRRPISTRDITIYLGHAATTPMRPEILEAKRPYFSEHFGNPSRLHSYGLDARMAIERPREHVVE